MKLKLTGPKEGQTINLNGIQFVDGYAEHHCVPITLARQHGVVAAGEELTFNVEAVDTENVIKELLNKDSEMCYDIGDALLKSSEAEEITQKHLDPADSTPEETSTEITVENDVHNPKESINSEQKELNAFVEAKKKELSKEKIKTQADFTNFGEYKSYVGKLTGTFPRTKKQAKDLVAEYVKTNGVDE